MSIYRLPAGALLLDGSALEVARYAVEVAQRARARNGLPPSAQLAQLGAALAAAGPADAVDDDPVQPDAMTTTEAAAQLGCSARQARRLAPRLGGQLVGGRWLVDRVAVSEHIEGRTTP